MGFRRPAPLRCRTGPAPGRRHGFCALASRSRVADTNMAEASTNLRNALLLQSFSLFAMQQQANVFALQSSLLAGR